MMLSIQLLAFLILLLVGVPALFAGIWISLHRKGRFESARALSGGVSVVFAIALVVALIWWLAELSDKVMTLGVLFLIPLWVAGLPTFILALVFAAGRFYPDRSEQPNEPEAR